MGNTLASLSCHVLASRKHRVLPRVALANPRGIFYSMTKSPDVVNSHDQTYQNEANFVLWSLETSKNTLNQRVPWYPSQSHRNFIRFQLIVQNFNVPCHFWANYSTRKQTRYDPKLFFWKTFSTIEQEKLNSGCIRNLWIQKTWGNFLPLRYRSVMVCSPSWRACPPIVLFCIQHKLHW